MHRRHAQSVYDAALLEYNDSIRESLSTEMHPHKSLLLLYTIIFMFLMQIFKSKLYNVLLSFVF